MLVAKNNFLVWHSLSFNGKPDNKFSFVNENDVYMIIKTHEVKCRKYFFSGIEEHVVITILHPAFGVVWTYEHLIYD